MTSIKFSHQVPMLPVHDMDLTLNFYAEKLGFSKIWKWDDPPTVASASRDDLNMLFTLDAKKSFQSTGLEIMIFLKGIHELYDEYQQRELTFSDPLEQKPWDLWEFCIMDLNGYYLRFAQGVKL